MLSEQLTAPERIDVRINLPRRRRTGLGYALRVAVVGRLAEYR